MNISRIPTSICKQLQKLKAKFQSVDTTTKQSSSSTSSSTSSSNSTNLTVPEGYYLVEFFGTHDFGWLKQDSTLPMTSDGSLAEFGGKLGATLLIIFAKITITIIIIILTVIIIIITIIIIMIIFIIIIIIIIIIVT